MISLPFSPVFIPPLPLSFDLFSLADGQLARRTMVQQVKNPLTFYIFSLALSLASSVLYQRQIVL